MSNMPLGRGTLTLPSGPVDSGFNAVSKNPDDSNYAGLADELRPDPEVTNFPVVRTILLGNLVMPGKWTLVSAERVFGWQIQKGTQIAGATIFPIGDELIAPKFRVEIWRSYDYGLYRQMRKRFLKKPTLTELVSGGAAALRIGHPELNDLGCDAVVVHKVGATKQEKGGLWVAEIEFLQFRAPKLLKSKTPTTTPGNQNNRPPARTKFELDNEVKAEVLRTLDATPSNPVP